MGAANTIQATVTAKAGPAKQATAIVITGLRCFTIDVKKEVIQFFTSEPGTGPTQEFDLHGVTTVTDTVTAGNHVIVIS